MPICTSCTTPLSHLYSLYASANNYRLEQCPKCFAIADPYVEHDVLLLVLDLILLKRDVFRHLIYNRGSAPKKLYERSSQADTLSVDLAGAPQSDHWFTVMKLCLGLSLVDTFTRWSRSFDVGTASVAKWSETFGEFASLYLYCLGETAVFQCGITVAVAVVAPTTIWLRRRFGSSHPSPFSVPSLFRLSHVPLGLLYASLTRFFLLFLLSIWSPSLAAGDTIQYHQSAPVLERHPNLRRLYSIFDDDALDREWVVRNVLGGMAAGFGLRVVLDSQPILIMTIIVMGWMCKAAYMYLIFDYWHIAPGLLVVHGSATRYSIP